jgi:hypothetical protein
MVPVDTATATSLLFAIGVIDIFIALSVLFKPQKLVLVYATVWAFMTALQELLQATLSGTL